MILVKTYSDFPFCEKEILRYAGSNPSDSETISLIRECISEAKEVFRYKVCYREIPLSVDDNICDFGFFSIDSKNLSQNLKGCARAIVFAATIGVGLDRLIAKYSRLSPAKALIFQAVGATQTETLCDAFSRDIAKEYNVTTCPRFSPGYGDLPLEIQKDIFSLLDCERKIGLTLTDSLLMSPSKSVTAFIGLKTEV